MRKKPVAALIMALATILSCGMALADDVSAPVKLKDLLVEAERANPELEAQRLKFEASKERIPQAAAFEDPMLGIGFQSLPIDSFAFNRDGMTGKMFEISQMFPFYGKRALKQKAATFEASSMEAEYNDRALMLRSEVKKVYYELYLAQKSLDVLDRNIELLDIFKKTAETRYSVGTGMYRDIIKAQLETSMMSEKKIELQKEERTKRAYLGSLLGRQAYITGPVEDIAPTNIGKSRDALTQEALTYRPKIKAADAKIGRGTAMVESARKDFFPDFTVKANYMQRDRLNTGMAQPDMLSMMVSVNLPVWLGSKLRPAVKEAAYERSAAEKERDAAVQETYYRVDSLLNEIEQSDRLIKLYKEVVIPKANEDISAGLAQYEVGKGDYMSLLDSRRTLFDYETGYYNALAMREKAVAELETIIGKEF